MRAALPVVLLCASCANKLLRRAVILRHEDGVAEGR